MTIVEFASLSSYALPGLQHRTLAQTAHGLSRLEVWSQKRPPGAATPPHYHKCEEAVVIEQGSGQAISGGQALSFGAGTTLVFVPGEVHQIVNGDSGEMVLLAALSESPARVFTPDGEQMVLPWQQANV